jgi:hypothetical protein
MAAKEPKDHKTMERSTGSKMSNPQISQITQIFLGIT